MSYIRITKHYLHLPYLWLGIIEFGLIFFSVFLLNSVQTRLSGLPLSLTPFDSENAMIYAIVLSLGSLAMGVYMAMMHEGFMSMLFRSLVAYCFLGALGISVLGFIFPSIGISSSDLFWLVMLVTVLTLLARQVFLQVVDSDQLTRRVAILGTGKAARELKKVCDKNGKSFGIRTSGLMTLSKEGDAETGAIPVPEDLPDYCLRNGISEIVVALEEQRRSEGGALPLEALTYCKVRGVQVTSALEFYERNMKKVNLELVRPSWIIFSDGFYTPTYNKILKRVFDIAVSLILAVVLAPFVLLAMFLVFIETGRPIFYSQVRTGLNGKDFRIYKIRSMRQDAEEGGKAVWASANDSRITKVGAFIRNTRLDEIPQLWNVIRGDMSFVGPRPERPEFVEQLNKEIPNYSYRHAVKPGLMGWAQLNYPYGASVEDAKGKLEYDLYYTKNQSFIMDLIIMVQTVEVVLLGKGVH